MFMRKDEYYCIFILYLHTEYFQSQQITIDNVAILI